MISMNTRFKGFGFGSKRKSSASNHTLPPQAAENSSTPTLAGRPGHPSNPSSTTNLEQMNPGGITRPPSYSPSYPPGPPGQVRTTSPPMAGGSRTPPAQMMGGPPPINTASVHYPPQHRPPMGAPQIPGVPGGPPQYGVSAPYPTQGPPPMIPYAGRNNAVEVEGAGRSKSQLIVGIDFVSILRPSSYASPD